MICTSIFNADSVIYIYKDIYTSILFTTSIQSIVCTYLLSNSYNSSMPDRHVSLHIASIDIVNHIALCIMILFKLNGETVFFYRTKENRKY